MKKQEKSPRQWESDKVVARSYFSRALFTSFAPATALFSLASFDVALNDNDTVRWFNHAPVSNSLLLAAIVGLLCFAVVEVIQGIRRASRYERAE